MKSEHGDDIRWVPSRLDYDSLLLLFHIFIKFRSCRSHQIFAQFPGFVENMRNGQLLKTKAKKIKLNSYPIEGLSKY